MFSDIGINLLVGFVVLSVINGKPVRGVGVMVHVIIIRVSEGWQEKQRDMDFPVCRCRGEVVQWQRETGTEQARVDEGVAGVPGQVWAGRDLVLI